MGIPFICSSEDLLSFCGPKTESLLYVVTVFLEDDFFLREANFGLL